MNIFQKTTLKNLKENRTRTLVTIVGIILSAAMFTATTISISSLRHCLIQYYIYEDGNWHGSFHGLSWENAEKLRAHEDITQAVSMEFLGYSYLEGCKNEDKPFLGVFGIQENFTELMPIHITSGRMPENGNEILLPSHLYLNGGIKHKLNDTLELNLGARVDNNGETLTNDTIYLNANGMSEEFVPGETKIFTVTGFYERPSFENYSAPAYTALTIGSSDKSHKYDMYVRTDSGWKTVPTLNSIYSGLDSSDPVAFKTNYSLLRIYGYSGESRYNSVLFGLAFILIGIITFGSISLIYNAFSISVSERTKQFGLMSSIGATKKQLTRSVLFEALFLGCIGIPFGMLSGLLGIGVTFHFTKDMIGSILGIPGSPGVSGTAMVQQALGPVSSTSLTLYPSLPALGAAVAISLLTILVSAYIPVRRALKKSAIDAIRQTDDIAIRPGKVRTSRLTKKLFGFEGMLAAKNYKRNRKKYRATVISLFLSIALFVSASSWCSYLTESVQAVLLDSGCDLLYTVNNQDLEEYSPDALLSEIKEMKDVTDATYLSDFYISGSIKSSAASQKYLDYQSMVAQQEENGPNVQELSLTDFHLIFLEDNAFRSYLKEQNLPESVFYNKKSPTAVVVDSLKKYNGTDGKYYSFTMFSDILQADPKLYLVRQTEGYTGYHPEINQDTGKVQFIQWAEGTGEEEICPLEDAALTIPLSFGAAVQQAPPLFLDSEDLPQLYYPYSFLDDVFSGLEDDTEYWSLPSNPPSKDDNVRLQLKCGNHTETFETIRKLLAEKTLPTEGLCDYAASMDNDRAMVTVINVFAFGFITLISLIAAANVFNTISTNIILRRREFAMLRSVGMTPEGFQKMMNFECLLYGFKGLLYGLPVSFLMTWIIYHTISNGLDTEFFIPWYSIAIAVGSVFLVVFATMLYSMGKIKKENTIDVLKNENV
ncbi:MAG: FtsX-like permease family protein [Lachnospiraceae bacterium]|nr:FtsX-like permease family protein [Lachnospiraceae bacterium]